jgi:hypothetical protein
MGKQGRRFLDYAIDGERLYPRMLRRGFDTVTPLWLDAPMPRYGVESVERLLGTRPGDAPQGRVCVYVCPECGDLGCGAVTIRLVLTDHSVEWRDWGYQNDYDDGVVDDSLSDLPNLTFDRRQYTMALVAAAQRLTAPG